MTSVKPLAKRIGAVVLPELPNDLGVVWRPLQPADSVRLFDLIVAAEVADQAPYRTSLEEVEEFFDGEWKDFDTDSLVGIDQSGQFVVYGLIEMPPGDTTTIRAYLSGAVHPDSRGVGLGTAAVNWLKAVAAFRLSRLETTANGRIAAVLENNAPGHGELFAAAGFTPRRFYHSLRRAIVGPAAGPLPQIDLGDGLELRPFSTGLDEPVRLAHNDSFRDHWGSEPKTAQDWAQGRSPFMPEWSFVVVDTAASAELATELGCADGPVVAGYIMVSKYEQDWVVSGYSSGYIDTLGVRRHYRGRGIASKLLVTVMTKLGEQGIEAVELDVDSANPSGAFGMYTNLGFEITNGSTMYSIEY